MWNLIDLYIFKAELFSPLFHRCLINTRGNGSFCGDDAYLSVPGGSAGDIGARCYHLYHRYFRPFLQDFISICARRIAGDNDHLDVALYEEIRDLRTEAFDRPDCLGTVRGSRSIAEIYNLFFRKSPSERRNTGQSAKS